MSTSEAMVAWLTPVLGEVERRARAAVEAMGYPPDVTVRWHGNENLTVREPAGNHLVAVSPWGGGLYEIAEHMAVHDPGAALGDVAAKRAILALWQDPEQVRHLPAGVSDGRDPDEVEAQVAVAEAIDGVVRTIAAGYDWWLGYRPEWAPGRQP